MSLPAPHGDKLRALLTNDKLPASDQERVRLALERYRAWRQSLEDIGGDRETLIPRMVDLLNDYRLSIDIDLVFDSPNDFLYRQKGQLKLDNTVTEEFAPFLIAKVFADELNTKGLTLGPVNCFSHLRFDSDIRIATPGGGMTIRSKDQDFAIARPVFIRAAHRADFADAVEHQSYIAYVAAEIKTNLDKTMFQEAAATAYDLRLAVPNARYYLLCEWLDMTPISTSVTAIEKVIILRKAKRLASNVRATFATAAGRRAARDELVSYLRGHPFSAAAFALFVSEIASMLGDSEAEDVVIGRGWF